MPEVTTTLAVVFASIFLFSSLQRRARESRAQAEVTLTAEPHHAPAARAEEKEVELRGAQDQMAQVRRMRDEARKKLDRMKSVLLEIAQACRDCPGSDVPMHEITHLVQQAEDAERDGGNAEEILRGGVTRIEAQLREAYEDRSDYPRPEFLAPFMGAQMINIGVAGGPGTGKSTFINTARDLRQNDPESVRTSNIKQCTMEENRVELRIPGLDGVVVNLWDLPGGGTDDFPTETYIRKFGIRYFDCVMCFTTRTFLEAESRVIAEMKRWHVPYFVVRNQVDTAIHAAMEGKKDELEVEELSDDLKQEIQTDTIQEIKQELVVVKQLSKRAYCISSYYRNRSKYDFQVLIRDVATAVKTGRVDMTRDCPICMDEFADYGGEGGALLTICTRCRCNVCSVCRPSLHECPLCRAALE